MWTADLLVNMILKPFLKPFIDGDKLDRFGDELMDWIKKALRPVQQVAEWAAEIAGEPLRNFFDLMWAWFMGQFYLMFNPFFDNDFLDRYFGNSTDVSLPPFQAKGLVAAFALMAMMLGGTPLAILAVIFGIFV